MTSRSAYSIPMLAIVCLVALRVAVGWYFFDAARTKQADRNFSSAGFLSQAKGPLANYYKAKLPDFHNWREMMAVPQQDKPNPHELSDEPEPWKEFSRRSYSEWLEPVVVNWGRRRQQVTDHFQWDDDQKKQAGNVFDYYEGKLRSHLDANREDFEAYRHELYRLATWSRDPSADDVPFQEARIAKKESDIRAKAATLQGPLQQIENDYLKELVALATPEQIVQVGSPPAAPNALARFDRFLIFIHFAIGACLVIGLLTRLAALGAGLFMVTVVLSQPPWIVGYQTVGYPIILMIACFVLMALGAGRWAGLDYFLPCCCSGKCSTSKAKDSKDLKDSNKGTPNASA